MPIPQIAAPCHQCGTCTTLYYCTSCESEYCEDCLSYWLDKCEPFCSWDMTGDSFNCIYCFVSQLLD